MCGLQVVQASAAVFILGNSHCRKKERTQSGDGRKGELGWGACSQGRDGPPGQELAVSLPKAAQGGGEGAHSRRQSRPHSQLLPHQLALKETLGWSLPLEEVTSNPQTESASPVSFH